MAGSIIYFTSGLIGSLVGSGKLYFFLNLSYHATLIDKQSIKAIKGTIQICYTCMVVYHLKIRSLLTFNFFGLLIEYVIRKIKTFNSQVLNFFFLFSNDQICLVFFFF